MPKGRTFNRGTVTRALARRYGVYFYRHAARHDEYRRDVPDAPPYQGFLPRHSSIAEGTVKSLLTQLGITDSVRRALGMVSD